MNTCIYLYHFLQQVIYTVASHFEKEEYYMQATSVSVSGGVKIWHKFVDMHFNFKFTDNFQQP